MRIVVLSNLYPPDVIGGYEIACAQAVDALRARGHETLVLTSSRGRPAPAEGHVRRLFRLADVWDLPAFSALDEAARLRLLSDAAFVNADNVRAAAEAVVRFRPDVAYLHNLYGLGGLGLVALLGALNVPWVWQLGDAVPVLLCGDGRRVVPALAREFARRARGHFIGVSMRVVDEIGRAGVRLNGRVEILPCWVAGEPSHAERAYAPGGVLRVVSAGHLKPQKGIDVLIEAFALLRDRGVRNVTLDLYGNAEDQNRYPRLVEHLGLGSVVTLRGFLPHSELVARYRNYDVFAFPTWEREPFGLVPLEAAAHGGCVPLISRSCGIGEWLVHGVQCLKVSPDAHSVAVALRAAAEGETPLAELGRRARRLAWRELHIGEIVPRIENTLADAAGHGAAGPGRVDPPWSAETAAELHRTALRAEDRVRRFVFEEARDDRGRRVARRRATPGREDPAMPNFRFFDAGCEPSRGPKAVVVLARRAWCRLMRPMLHRQEQVYRGFHRRLDDLDDRVGTVAAAGWDHEAVSRRLAMLEDQVEALHKKLETADRTHETRASSRNVGEVELP